MRRKNAKARASPASFAGGRSKKAVRSRAMAACVVSTCVVVTPEGVEIAELNDDWARSEPVEDLTLFFRPRFDEDDETPVTGGDFPIYSKEAIVKMREYLHKTSKHLTKKQGRVANPFGKPIQLEKCDEHRNELHADWRPDCYDCVRAGLRSKPHYR